MMQIIENIKNKLYTLFNKIIVYSFSKLQSLDKQSSINNTHHTKKKNTRIIKNINYDNNEEMYGQFIYFN
jgi:hypothetical protein